MDKILNNIIRFAFGIVLFLVLYLLFFSTMDYAFSVCKVNWKCLGGIVLGFCVFVPLFLLAQKRLPESLTSFLRADRLVPLLAVCLLPAQIYICYQIFFRTGWDAGVLENTIRGMASDGADFFANDLWHTAYFSRYPNNLMLAYLGARILELNAQTQLFTGEFVMMSCVVLNCVINTAACYLVYKTARLFTEPKYAFAGFLLCVLSAGFSPWSVIFYSDSAGLFIPILTVYLHFRPVKNQWLRYLCRFLGVFTAVFGYFIKPQCLIPLIAIVLYEIIRLTGQNPGRNLVRVALLLLCCATCFSWGTAFLDDQAEHWGVELIEEYEIGMPHFLMMGANEETSGKFSQADVDYSESFLTAEQRNAANLEEAARRITDMGFFRYLIHLTKKMLLVFNDGTFAWELEGNFFASIPEPPNPSAAAFLRSYYHNASGEPVSAFAANAQLYWLAILVFALISCRAPQTEKNAPLTALYLALLGFVLFEILFEVRARYIYIFVPVFCVLAAVGIKAAVEAVHPLIQKIGERK